MILRLLHKLPISVNTNISSYKLRTGSTSLNMFCNSMYPLYDLSLKPQMKTHPWSHPWPQYISTRQVFMLYTSVGVCDWHSIINISKFKIIRLKSPGCVSVCVCTCDWSSVSVLLTGWVHNTPTYVPAVTISQFHCICSVITVRKWTCWLQMGRHILLALELDDKDRHGRFWRHRPDGFTVNEKEYIIYTLEFKGVSDTHIPLGERLAEIQHLDVTQHLKNLFKNTQWTVE